MNSAITDEEKMQFLLDVANARDRGNPAERSVFLSRYREWFPSYNDTQLAKHQAHYAKVRAAWCAQTREFPIEEPDREFGFSVAILRHQLRVLWIEQSSDSKQRQDLTLSQIATAIAGMDRQPKEAWRSLQIDALRWLEKRLSQLKACENPECESRRTFFFRTFPNDKYCCADCCATAKELRKNERDALKAPKQYKRSEDARENMSRSARKRWGKRDDSEGHHKGFNEP